MYVVVKYFSSAIPRPYPFGSENRKAEEQAYYKGILSDESAPETESNERECQRLERDGRECDD